MTKALRSLQRSLNSLIKHNKEDSFSTHINRSKRLEQTINKIGDKYTNLANIRDMRQRHIDYIVQEWKKEELSPGTIKNRMSDLRWLSRKIDKQNIVRRTNAEYGIERRQYTNNEINHAKELDREKLDQLNNEYVQKSLELQEAFGLRREESIKFRVEQANQGNHVKLQASWCKGGREREIPITNDRQRQLLNEVKEFCKERATPSLIPSENSYKQQLKAYTNHTERNGLDKNHGLRHQYAQDRYKELTGWECPKRGGEVSRDMTVVQKKTDEQVRLQISKELGHNRLDVTNVYLGGKK